MLFLNFKLCDSSVIYSFRIKINTETRNSIKNGTKKKSH